MYFKKKYSATLLVLGVACALKFLVDKMALGQWVLIELRFPFCQYSSNRCSVSFTCPADRQWASLYVAILQQTVWAHPEKKEVNPLWIYLIKPTDALISQIYFCQETLHVSGQFLCSIIRNFPLYIRHWYMPCKFDDSFQARPDRAWKLSSNLHGIRVYQCRMYSGNLLTMDRGTVRNM